LCQSDAVHLVSTHTDSNFGLVLIVVISKEIIIYF